VLTVIVIFFVFALIYLDDEVRGRNGLLDKKKRERRDFIMAQERREREQEDETS